MLPILIKFSSEGGLSQWLLYLLALAMTGYAAYAGWIGAVGPRDPKTGKFTEPTQQNRLARTLGFGLAGAVLARIGLLFALPARMFLGGRGEGIPVHTYGVMIGTGFLSAVWLASKLAQREWRGEEGNKKRDQIYDLAFWVFLSGFGGAMLLFRIVNWKETPPLSTFFTQPAKLIDCVTGGLVFYGGLIGAAVAAFVWCRVNKVNFLRLADFAIPTVSLGQCFGRLGCFSAGCCWGDVTPAAFKLGVHFPGPTMVRNLLGGDGWASSLAYQSQAADSKWVVESTGEIFDHMVPGAIRIADWVHQHGTTLPVYPTQITESIGQFAIFLGLLSLRSYRRFHGQIFALWLMMYAVLRSTIELYRGDFERGTIHGLVESIPLTAWYNISTSQFISLCMFALGASILVREGRKVWGGGSMPVGAAPAQ